MNYLNRKGYTLSQFILVWILGAIFVIFLFLTVSRYRATAQAKEAETFLQAVRLEQEDRCAIGRKYAVYANHLKAFYKYKKSTKHITYDLSSGNGITAHNKLYGYHISMPSYADGRICCDDCQKLDRYYSPCSVLTKRKDFIPADQDCTVYVQSKSKKSTRSRVRPGKGTAAKPVEQPSQPALRPVEKSMQPTHDTDASASGAQQPAAIPEPVADTPVLPEPESSQQPVKPEEPAVSDCPIPDTGDFYIDSCEVYHKGAQGAVMHTWNSETCRYDVVQNCMVPAHWQTVKSSKSEHGLYPSDLDNYCTRLMQGSPCETNVSSGEECFSAEETCYKSCQFMERTQVQEAANIILYDVEVQIEQLRCVPAKTITVSVP